MVFRILKFVKNRYSDEKTGRNVHHCRIYFEENVEGVVLYKINENEIFYSLKDLIECYKKKTLPIEVEPSWAG